MKDVARFAGVVVMLVALGGCANMGARERNAALGAAVGGVAGSLLTDGGTLGTLGGAAIGGYLGHQVER